MKWRCLFGEFHMQVLSGSLVRQGLNLGKHDDPPLAMIIVVPFLRFRHTSKGKLLYPYEWEPKNLNDYPCVHAFPCLEIWSHLVFQRSCRQRLC